MYSKSVRQIKDMDTLGLVLVILIIVLTVCCMIKYSHPRLELIDIMKPPIPLSKFDGRFKTGDLLFMSCAGSSQDIIKALTNSSLSHCAMIVVPPRDKYPDTPILLWECDVGQRYRPGPRLVPMKEKIERYDMEKEGLMLLLPTKREIEFEPLLLFIIECMQEMEFDNTLLSFLIPFVFPSKYVYCSNIIAKTLNHFGIEDLSENSISPAQLMNRVVNYEPYMLISK